MGMCTFVVALSIMAISASSCKINPAIPTSNSLQSPVTTVSTKPPSDARLPATVAPPAPLSDYPILGDAYNPPDPDQPEASFYMDAYELRPNLMFIKAGTLVTFVNVDNKPFFVESVDNLFFGITSPLGLSWSYFFDTPGVFAFTISPYNATEVGVIVVTQ
jgi:hypothetical protein